MISKWSVCEIMELVYLFVVDLPLKVVTNLMGRSSAMVTDWYSFCREVYATVVTKKGKMKGTDTNPVQIDEARFMGHRKYNRGHMLAGDKAPESEDDDAEVGNN